MLPNSSSRSNETEDCSLIAAPGNTLSGKPYAYASTSGTGNEKLPDVSCSETDLPVSLTVTQTCNQDTALTPLPADDTMSAPEDGDASEEQSSTPAIPKMSSRSLIVPVLANLFSRGDSRVDCVTELPPHCKANEQRDICLHYRAAGKQMSEAVTDIITSPPVACSPRVEVERSTNTSASPSDIAVACAGDEVNGSGAGLKRKHSPDHTVEGICAKITRRHSGSCDVLHQELNTISAEDSPVHAKASEQCTSTSSVTIDSKFLSIDCGRDCVYSQACRDSECDVSFQLDDGKHVSAHRSVLSAQSDVLHAMLCGDFVEARVGEPVNIRAVSSQVFICLMHCMYGCDMEQVAASLISCTDCDSHPTLPVSSLCNLDMQCSSDGQVMGTKHRSSTNADLKCSDSQSLPSPSLCKSNMETDLRECPVRTANSSLSDARTANASMCSMDDVHVHEVAESDGVIQCGTCHLSSCLASTQEACHRHGVACWSNQHGHDLYLCVQLQCIAAASQYLISEAIIKCTHAIQHLLCPHNVARVFPLCPVPPSR